MASLSFILLSGAKHVRRTEPKLATLRSEARGAVKLIAVEKCKPCCCQERALIRTALSNLNANEIQRFPNIAVTERV